MKKYFLKDKSINNVDDDQFRYQDFANNLRKIIECNEVPFNIAIVGKWGLGKSSLINMALAPLRNKNNDFLICDINAWKYEKDEIGKAFLKELWEKIKGKKVFSFHFFHKEYSDILESGLQESTDKSNNKRGLSYYLKSFGAIFVISIIAFIIYCCISNWFYGVEFGLLNFFISTLLRYCKNIGSTLIIPIIVWLAKVYIDKMNESSYKKFEINFPLVTQADYEIYLEKLLEDYHKKNVDKKIIVVIDDLDRLSADKIVEALDALKLFMEYDKFIFIVPFDDEILKNALKQNRLQSMGILDGEYDGEMVLDKIFQYKLYLPQLIKYDMRNYAFEICKNDCSDFIKEYFNSDCKLFEEIVGKILIHSGVSTPRQVKKIINTFIENVMVARDREQAGKVAEKFVTEKVGLQTIAKISVLQSDYNEFYDLLFKDINIINEILDIYRGNGEIQPSELLKEYYICNEDQCLLKKQYEPLVNYLIFTENLGQRNITPYLYMAQTKEGVLVGDKKQQDFMAALESCNFVSVKQLIGETPILTNLLIEQLKFNESPLMGNIILSALDCYESVPDNNNEDLAYAITERIPNIISAINDFRYDLLNIENLIEVCHISQNDEYNSLIEYAINCNELDKNYKNRVRLINKISKNKNELSVDILNKFQMFTRQWILSDESDIKDIIEFTKNDGVDCIAMEYGEDYVQKIAKHITDNDDFDNNMITQFGDVIRIFLQNNSIMDIVEWIEPCYEYPIMHKILDESINENQYKQNLNSINIAKKIVEIGVGNLKEEYGYNILSKLNYEVNDDDIELFDKFFANTITDQKFSDMMIAFAKENSFELLPNTINELVKKSLEHKDYAEDIKRLLQFFTEEQANTFWKELENMCRYNSNRDYGVVENLIVELYKEDQYNNEMADIIERIIIADFARYYTQTSYFLFVIQVISTYVDVVTQTVINNYSIMLMNALPTNTNNVVNAYRVVNNNISDDIWLKNINTILKYVSKETYAVIYDIATSRVSLFNNEENNNLSLLTNFLVDNINISDNPNDVINTISENFLGISNVDKLVNILMDIEYDEDNASVKLANLFDAMNVEDIIRIIIDEYKQEDCNKEKLMQLFSKSKKYSDYELLHSIDECKENINKNDLLSILEYCDNSISEFNLESFVNIIEYMLDNYFEKDVCNQILSEISGISQNIIIKQKERMCKILVKIFKESSSEENKKKACVIILEKKLGRKAKGMLDEEEVQQYKSYIS